MSHTGTPGAFAAMMPVMADACTADPVPTVATTANAANAAAPVFAHQGVDPSARLKPRSHTYMAPPSMVPAWSRTRYFTDANTSTYLVAMPNTPVIHIQNTAPGPPARMAVATPDDGTRADGGRQRRGQRAEVRYVALPLGVLLEGHADGGRQLALDEAGLEREKHVRAQKEPDHGRAPHERVDAVEDFNHNGSPL